MFKWLRSFFYSDDPEVRLADGLSEYDAAQYHEILANSGIMSVWKDMSPFAASPSVWPTMNPTGFAIWVKESDVEPAIGVLGHLITRYLTDEAREVRERSRAS